MFLHILSYIMFLLNPVYIKLIIIPSSDKLLTELGVCNFAL